MYAEPPSNTKFKPGQSGNPNGRPKRLNEQDMVVMIQQIMKLYADAKSGNRFAHKTILGLKDILNN